jgi:hypothetical protein
MASPPLLPIKFQATLTPPNEYCKQSARIVKEGEFEPEQHFYPRVLNAQIHPLVQSFFSLGNDRIIARYTHLNPQVDAKELTDILSYVPKHFQWAGKKHTLPLFFSDMFYI